jgi:hypothetical protein
MSIIGEIPNEGAVLLTGGFIRITQESVKPPSRGVATNLDDEEEQKNLLPLACMTADYRS